MSDHTTGPTTERPRRPRWTSTPSRRARGPAGGTAETGPTDSSQAMEAPTAHKSRNSTVAWLADAGFFRMLGLIIALALVAHRGQRSPPATGSSTSTTS